jgi:hypothetical protein
MRILNHLIPVIIDFGTGQRVRIRSIGVLREGYTIVFQDISLETKGYTNARSKSIFKKRERRSLLRHISNHLE